MNKKIAGWEQGAASSYVVFSANELVIITANGNPLGLCQVRDLARPQLKFVRVTGEKVLAIGGTIEFSKLATAQEGTSDLGLKILDKWPADPVRSNGVAAVKEGRADAWLVYYSAAIAARNDAAIMRFPESVNLSETIRNAATVPATTRHASKATAFVAFLLTPEAQPILQGAGQPPVVSALRKGAVPAEMQNTAK